MNNQKTTGRKPGDTMKIGAIIAIIGGSIETVITLMVAIFIFKMKHFTNIKTHNFNGTIFNVIAIISLIFSLISIVSIIFNSLLLTSKLKSNIAPGIFAIISLGLSIIGIVAGVLILTGKFEDQINPEQDKDFVSKNFNTGSQTQQKPETAGSWRNYNQSSPTPVNSEIVENEDEYK